MSEVRRSEQTLERSSNPTEIVNGIIVVYAGTCWRLGPEETWRRIQRLVDRNPNIAKAKIEDASVDLEMKDGSMVEDQLLYNMPCPCEQTGTGPN